MNLTLAQIQALKAAQARGCDWRQDEALVTVEGLHDDMQASLYDLQCAFGAQNIHSQGYKRSDWMTFTITVANQPARGGEVGDRQ